MREPETPANERERQETLDATALLYSPAEERFDRITRLTARHFDVPMTLVSLVDQDRQWFKSSQGLLTSETPREISFCGHAIARNGLLVIEDTLTDPDFSDNPLVLRMPQIRFYAGRPLLHRGMAMGTLCILDNKPRRFSEADRDSLNTLAACIESEFQLSSLSHHQQQLLAGTPKHDRQKMIDPITQTWNDAALSVLLHREVAHAASMNLPYALLTFRFRIADADFSELDEQEGARLVRQVTQDIRASLRPTDLIARTGLSALVVFAPDCDGEMSEILGNRVLSRILNRRYSADNQDIVMAINAGIVISSGDARSARLLEVSEQALADSLDRNEPMVRYVV
ncbi:MAG: GAF domain-containing protein [Proteobacteria bacterium]|nr:GAF domain-containing protein [Pseudomonadota bacterium]MDA1300978.1 GAF domain-containing protein [Pseudomonadota bacterium]